MVGSRALLKMMEPTMKCTQFIHRSYENRSDILLSALVLTIFFLYFYIHLFHPRKHIVNDRKQKITIVYGLIWISNYIS